MATCQGRWAAGVEILERHDHVETALDFYHPSPMSEPLQGFLDYLGREAAAGHHDSERNLRTRGGSATVSGPGSLTESADPKES